MKLDRTPFDSALVGFNGAWDEFDRAGDPIAEDGLVEAWRLAIDAWRNGSPPL